MDDFIAAGLYDPEAPNASQRRELIEHLLDRGFTPEQILDAASWVGQPTDIAAVISRPAPKRLTLSELSERTASSMEEIAVFRAALGLPVPDDPSATVPDYVAADFALYQLACSEFGRAGTLEFVRLVGASITNLMEAGRELLTRSLRGKGATELQVMLANETAFAAWLALGGIIAHVMGEHASRDLWFEAQLIEGDLKMAVAFVDLVDSTAWSAQQTGPAHARAIALFEQRAADLAVSHGGRIVKFIGDEAMIAASSAEAAVAIAVELSEAASAEPSLPLARGAVGYGSVTARAGDYFGDLVNLVARATKAASAGGVVVTAEVAGALGDERWALSPLGSLNFRGVPESVSLFQVTRALSRP